MLYFGLFFAGNHLRPKISYEWQDNIKTWLGTDIFYEDNQGVFGQFGQNDRIVVGVEASF